MSISYHPPVYQGEKAAVLTTHFWGDEREETEPAGNMNDVEASWGF